MTVRNLAALWFFGLLANAAALAQDDVLVYSARADSVAITIYSQDLALITETRTVRLPATATTLIIQNVVDSLLPESAVINQLDRPLAQSNFDFDRLSPETLLTRSIGQTVTLVRTDPGTGVVSRVPANVIAASQGVVIGIGDGHEALYCSGLPEGIVFESIPDGLYSKPQLSLRLAAGVPGEKTIKISYLAHGFEWNADYVAQLNAGADALDLTGWATVSNASGTSFEQAELMLVAGDINLLPRGVGSLDPGFVTLLSRESPDEEISLRACFETQPPVPQEPVVSRSGATYGADAMGPAMTFGLLQREGLGDYYLYRIPWATDLGARQTKQLRFLKHDDVVIERFYRVRATSLRPRGGARIIGNSLVLESDESSFRINAATLPEITIRIDNSTASGLGEPLPAGSIRFFQAAASGTVFVGESSIPESPVGTGIELEHGTARDLLVEGQLEFSEGRRNSFAATYTLLNDKAQPVVLEISQLIRNSSADLLVDESSRPYERSGDYIVWRIDLPPGSESLSYRISAREL